ncbi:MAG: hypothetical protein ACREOP_01590 [Thermodesulfobacteriota bacterium]
MPRRTRAPQEDLFNKFEGGLAQDSKERIEVPFWKILDNGWIRDKNEFHGRPHPHSYLGLTNPAGIAESHDNEPIVLANGSVYVNGVIKGSYTGSGPVSYDCALGKTVITAGGVPVIYDGTTVFAMSHTDVKSLALAYGPSKSRLFFVKNSDPSTLWFTTRGNWNDIGSTKTDEDGFDFKTEGGRIKGWESDILHVMEFQGDLMVFCRGGLYRLDFSAKEGLMYPVKHPVAKIEIWDVQPLRFPTGIYFVNRLGPHVYSIGDVGPFVAPIPIKKNRRALRTTLLESEARLGVDMARDLVYLRTRASEDLWVLHNEEDNIFSRWDIDVTDAKTIDGVVYMTNPNGVFTLEDQGDGQNYYDIRLRSGLLGFGNPFHLKRMESIGAIVRITEKSSYYLGFLPDRLSDATKVPTKRPKKYTGPENFDELVRLDEGTKWGFSIGAFDLVFRNYGEFILYDLYAQWWDKNERREDSA